MANERHVAREIRDEYMDTMSKIYYSYFKGYLSRLMKLQVRLFMFIYMLIIISFLIVCGGGV